MKIYMLKKKKKKLSRTQKKREGFQHNMHGFRN